MKQKSSGQALLVILLIMAVALTIGLAVVSRSITDIRISQEQEESARAFSAAEAGLESLLATGSAPGTIPVGGTEFTISTAETDLGNSQSFIFREKVDAGEAKTVWLVGHNADGNPDPTVAQCVPNNLRVFWGNEGTTRNDENTPALEATVFYFDSVNGSYETRKYTSDPNNGRAIANGFSTDDLVINPGLLEGVQFAFRRHISGLPGNMYVLRLKLIYSDDQPHILGVRAGGGANPTLPLQGTCYESTATSEVGIASRVEQCQYYPSLPGLFDYVLFSEANL